eukprot:2556419-Alexandrium_andersonii.AAC.1
MSGCWTLGGAHIIVASCRPLQASRVKFRRRVLAEWARDLEEPLLSCLVAVCARFVIGVAV